MAHSSTGYLANLTPSLASWEAAGAATEAGAATNERQKNTHPPNQLGITQEKAIRRTTIQAAAAHVVVGKMALPALACAHAVRSRSISLRRCCGCPICQVRPPARPDGPLSARPRADAPPRPNSARVAAFRSFAHGPLRVPAFRKEGHPKYP